MRSRVSKFVAVGTAALIAVMPMSTVLAQTPGTNDTKTVTVENVKETDAQAKVIAYRIVEPVYGEHGLVDYQTVGGIEIANLEAPTSEEVQAAVAKILANKASFDSVELTRGEGTSTFTGEAGAGLYVVLVSNSDTTIYNPALVAVNYGDAGDASTAEGGTVDMEAEFDFDNVAYLKSSTPEITKDIVVGESRLKGDLVSAEGENTTAGDTIAFEIKTTLPSYQTSENGTVYTNPRFEVKDHLDSKFANIANLVVLNGEGQPLAPETDYVITGGDGHQNFVIKFTEAYLMANGGMPVTITYETMLNEEGKTHFDENINTATLTYSNDPTEEDSVKRVKESTYHYTFSIEMDKVDEENAALPGAEFGLYTQYANNGPANEVAKVVTDADGKIVFTGLDTGIYYVKETKAPEGYTLNDTVYRVIIDAEQDSDGVLVKYSVVTSTLDEQGEWAQVGRFAYSNSPTIDKVVEDETGENENYGKVTNNITDEETTATTIHNTKLSRLPSTGGAGIAAFTIGGVSLFLGSAAVFAKSRNKKEED